MRIRSMTIPVTGRAIWRPRHFTLGHEFLLIWFGQSVSLFTIAMTRFALAIWTFQNSHSIISYSLVIVCISLPGLILSPLAGSVVDRHDRKRIIVIVDCVFIAVSLVLGLLAATGRLELWHVYGVGAVASASLAFRLPAYLATTALLVPKEHLGRASGLTHLAISLAQIAAPVASAPLLISINLSGIFTLNAAGFAISAAIVGFIHFPSAAKAAETPEKNRRNSIQDLRIILAYLRGWPGLMLFLVYCAVQSFVLMTVLVLFTPMVLSSHSQIELGTIMTVGGAGTLAGSFAMILYGAPKRVIMTVLWIDILSSASVAASGIVKQVPALCITLFVTMFGCAVFQATTQAFWQRKTPLDLHGRLFAIESALTTGTTPLAALLGGFSADRVFEPSFMPGGFLAHYFGAWIGTGEGAGIRFMFASVGLLIAMFGAVALLCNKIRRIEETVPDAY
jgi:DHA3 family macrolide efflux protein-like MFS transporter